MSVSAAQLRRIARDVGLEDNSTAERMAFGVGAKGVAWTFMGRQHPKAKRTPFLRVLAVCCTLESKAMLIEAAPTIYFTDDHYRGYPAVLVRLDAIGVSELTKLLETGRALKAAKKPAKKAAKIVKRAGRA